MPPLVAISKHTTASFPRPHVLYTVEVTRSGVHTVVERRYSDFVALNNELGVTKYSLPPKRILTTVFLPSAWVDDELIMERKAGLQIYVTSLLSDPEYSDLTGLMEFLLPASPRPTVGEFDAEDALPSTLSRKAALAMVKGGIETQAASMIAASYYPDWSADTRPPEGLNFAKFDILFFAFATPNSSSTLSWESGSTAILKRLVAAARASGKKTKIVLAVGGWGGSYWFSNAMLKQNRPKLIDSIVSAINKYDLDGVDIDWEYPNSPGAGNPYASADAAHLLYFFQHLRTALGSSKIISSAVTHMPWIGSNGSPLTDVSAYAAVMTYVNIMNYDVWGASSSPGPNAPLGNLCGSSGQPQASAHAAFKQWTQAGFPANKLLLGLPLYGYVSQSSRTSLSNSFAPEGLDEITEESRDDDTQQQHSIGRAWVKGNAALDWQIGAHPRTKISVPNVPDDDGDELSADLAPAANLQSWYGQQIPFSTLVSSGALVKNADGTYSGAGGFTKGWDNCSDTPFLFNTAQQTVVTYDDTFSLASKAAFARTSGMAGCFTWALDQDYGVRLQNVIRKNLGK